MTSNAVNFDKAGATKLIFVNSNDDIYDIAISFNLFDSRTSTAFLETCNFVLSPNQELDFDVAYFQNNFDTSLKGKMIKNHPIDEDTELLKKIFGCIRFVKIISRSTREEAKLYIYGSEEGSLKVFILDSSFANDNAFDYFHIDFNTALDSKSKFYYDCINNIDRNYPHGFSSKTYKLALDFKVSPADFIHRMTYLYELYFPSELNLSKLYNMRLFEQHTSTMRINKSLFQVWVGGKPLPEEYKRNQIKWQNILTAGWTYKLYTDEDAARFEFSSHESKKIYDSLPNPTAQSDLLRMEILNKHGGVYVDLDTVPFEPIDQLVSNFDFFGILFGPKWGSLFVDNYFIGSIQGHPIIKQAIKNIILLFSDRSSLDHLGSSDKMFPNVFTSIIPLTRAVYQHAGRGQTRDVVLPVTYFNNHSTTIFSYATHYPKRLWKK